MTITIVIGRATPLFKLIVIVDWLGKPKFGLTRGPTRILVVL